MHCHSKFLVRNIGDSLSFNMVGIFTTGYVYPFYVNPIGNLKMFIIPAIVLGMSGAGTNMRLMRTMMLEVLRQDYIRTAWSKGFREGIIVIRHALKNALIPVVTMRVSITGSSRWRGYY